MKKYLLSASVIFLFISGITDHPIYATNKYTNIIEKKSAVKTITVLTENPSKENKNQERKIVTPTGRIAKELGIIDKGFTTLIIFIGKIAIFLVSLIILKKIFLLTTNRPSQLIIDNFSNSSGSIDIDLRLLGLSQLGREKLVKEMEGVHQRLKSHIQNNGPSHYRPNDKLPLPQSIPDQRLSNLVSSLKELTPEQIDPIVHLLEIIFPVSGTKVNTILQSQGKEYERLGITFEIIDLRGYNNSKIYTIWETPQQPVHFENISEDPYSKSLPDRYHNLLRTATRWLAIELSRREMVTATPLFFFGKKRKYYQSQINNFFGVLNHASAPTHGHLFYKLALQDLEKAIQAYPQWYQPYENLGDTYSSKGRNFKNSQSLTWQRQAILGYDKALSRCNNEIVRRRIKVGRAIAQLNIGDELSIKESYREIRHLEQGVDPAYEMSSRFLYNLASWYAIAYSRGYLEQNIKQSAQRYLVCALVRDREKTLWEWSTKDPDFHSIRDRFPELQFALLKKINEFPDLPNTKGKDFVKVIEELLRKHNWL